MSIYIIARLSQNGKEIGYRLYDRKSQRYEDWQTSRLINSLKFNAIELQNAKLDDKGNVKGTAGVLKGYPEIDIEKDMVLGKNSYTVVGKDSEEGTYYTVDGYGVPREMHKDNLLRGIEKRGLTNAAIVEGKTIRAKSKFEEVGFKYNYLQKDFNTPNNIGLVKKWRVRIIKTGEPYGRQGCLINERQPLVEFISLDTNQFVSRYYVETILEHQDGAGLNIDGDVFSWCITGEDFTKILKWLRGLTL